MILQKGSRVKTLIVGYGSIGRRHAQIFKSNGSQVVILTSQKQADDFLTYSDLKICLKNENPEAIIISNRTSDHFPTLMNLNELGYSGVVLIEKPLFEKLIPISITGEKLFVAYNLRFHPGLLKLKSEIQNQKILTVNVYVGQNLKIWRPGRDYRDLYSGKKNLGGGVLRDLSHELDFITWLFGKPEELIARGGKISNLEIDSDDSWMILMKTNNAEQISLSLNYLDQEPSRFLIVNTNEHTYRVDLVRNEFTKDGMVEQLNVDRDFTYIEQSKAILQKDYSQLCTFEEGLDIVKLIETIEQSNLKKQWVKP